jgi:hypothetical protein
VAFAFSKIDAVRELLDPGSPLLEDSLHPGYMDLADQERVHASMRAYLHSWLGSDFDDFVQQTFSRFAYFGVSALGSSPRADGVLTRGIAPFRVADPFLWLLYNQKLVDGRK